MTSSAHWLAGATVGAMLVAACVSGEAARSRPAPAASTPRAPEADPAALLADVTAWDAATSVERRAAAESVAAREPDFELSRLETFSCGGQTHEVAICSHAESGLEFVLVPGGTFSMGSSAGYDETPEHRVTLTRPFLIARTEVTQAAYERVVGSNPSTFQGAGRPVEGVSWDDATGFCARVGLALPTEAQWEWACRSGTSTDWSTGSEPRSLQGHANIYDAHAKEHRSEIPYERSWRWAPTVDVNDGFATTAPVGSFSANAFGLHDMHGNVWEWCLDGFDSYPPWSATDPTGSPDGDLRVVRGGSWHNPAVWTRSAARYRSAPDYRSIRLGFRPAKEVGATTAALVAHPLPAPAGEASEALFSAVRRGRYSDALRKFGGIAEPTAADAYLAGYALMELNRPDDAAPHLEAAKIRGGSRWAGWPSAESLLDRVAEVRRLAPRALDSPLDDAIEVCAADATQWRAEILRAVPEFASVGRRVFGADLPRVRLYLLPGRTACERVCHALLGYEDSATWPDAVCSLSVAVFCEPDSPVERTRAPGPDAIGAVLRELAQAWCETYLMDRYHRGWPAPASRHPWLSEGVAEVIASLRDPGFLARRAAWLEENARSVRAPTFFDLVFFDDFYAEKGAFARQCLSALFVAELVGPLDKAAPARIRALVDAVGKIGPVGPAVRAATGKDLYEEFAKVVARFWR